MKPIMTPTKKLMPNGSMPIMPMIRVPYCIAMGPNFSARLFFRVMRLKPKKLR